MLAHQHGGHLAENVHNMSDGLRLLKFKDKQKLATVKSSTVSLIVHRASLN